MDGRFVGALGSKCPLHVQIETVQSVGGMAGVEGSACSLLSFSFLDSVSGRALGSRSLRTSTGRSPPTLKTLPRASCPPTQRPLPALCPELPGAPHNSWVRPEKETRRALASGWEGSSQPLPPRHWAPASLSARPPSASHPPLHLAFVLCPLHPVAGTGCQPGHSGRGRSEPRQTTAATGQPGRPPRTRAG